MFQWKNLFIKILLLKWKHGKLIKHLWKWKKMGKCIQDAEFLVEKFKKNPRGGATISKVRGLRKTYFSKVISLVSPAGPTMVGAKGTEKILNWKGSRSSENAAFFEYFLINSLLLNETVFWINSFSALLVTYWLRWFTSLHKKLHYLVR